MGLGDSGRWEVRRNGHGWSVVVPQLMLVDACQLSPCGVQHLVTDERPHLFVRART